MRFRSTADRMISIRPAVVFNLFSKLNHRQPACRAISMEAKYFYPLQWPSLSRTMNYHLTNNLLTL